MDELIFRGNERPEQNTDQYWIFSFGKQNCMEKIEMSIEHWARL